MLISDENYGSFILGEDSRLGLAGYFNIKVSGGKNHDVTLIDPENREVVIVCPQMNKKYLLYSVTLQSYLHLVFPSTSNDISYFGYPVLIPSPEPIPNSITYLKIKLKNPLGYWDSQLVYLKDENFINLKLKFYHPETREEIKEFNCNCLGQCSASRCQTETGQCLACTECSDDCYVDKCGTCQECRNLGSGYACRDIPGCNPDPGEGGNPDPGEGGGNPDPGEEDPGAGVPIWLIVTLVLVTVLGLIVILILVFKKGKKKPGDSAIEMTSLERQSASSSIPTPSSKIPDF